MISRSSSGTSTEISKPHQVIGIFRGRDHVYRLYFSSADSGLYSDTSFGDDDREVRLLPYVFLFEPCLSAMIEDSLKTCQP